MWRIGWTAALALGASCTAAPPAERNIERDAGAGLRQCDDIRGYLLDEARSGRAVHERPDASSPLLGRIAPPYRNEAEERDVAVGFAVRASRDGWLLIEGAADDPALTGRPPRPVYGARGWIRADGVGVGVQTSQAFARPNHSSAMVLGATGPDPLDDLVEISACDGNWVLGRWTIRDPSALRYERSAVVARDPLTVEAWATGICNIQETTCDGVSGDRPEPRPRRP